MARTSHERASGGREPRHAAHPTRAGGLLVSEVSANPDLQESDVGVMRVMSDGGRETDVEERGRPPWLTVRTAMSRLWSSAPSLAAWKNSGRDGRRAAIR
jgi:hypothetical protein